MQQGRSAEQALDLVKEALDQRTPITIFHGSIRFEQFALLRSQPLGHLNDDLDYEVSLVMAAQVRHTLAANAKLRTRLVPDGILSVVFPKKVGISNSVPKAA